MPTERWAEQSAKWIVRKHKQSFTNVQVTKLLLQLETTIYTALVCSHFEYCLPVWAGLRRQILWQIDSVQTAATRCILDCPDLDAVERLEQLQLLSLSYRGEINNAVFLCKCMNNVYNFNILHTRQYVEHTKCTR